MPRISIGAPGRKRRKIGYFYERFARTTERFGKRPKIDPFQIWLLKVVERVVKVKAVNVAGDPHCEPQKAERPALAELAYPTGRTCRGEA